MSLENKEREFNKIPDEILSSAKQLYLDHTPVTEIARRLSISRETIQYHVNTYWRKEREEISKGILMDVALAKRGKLLEISGMTLDIILKSLADLHKRTAPLSAFEARTVAALFAELDKIIKLDAGDPTDIIASNKPSTYVEIQQKLNMDPFSKPILIEEDKGEQDDKINVRTITNGNDEGSKI